MNFKRLLLTLSLCFLTLFTWATSTGVEKASSLTQITMDESDYLIIVDYVNTNLTNTHSYPSTAENYYGVSAYYSNFDIRSGSQDTSFVSAEEAIEEALREVYLPIKQTSALVEDTFVINYTTYDGQGSTVAMSFICSELSPLSFMKIDDVFVPPETTEPSGDFADLEFGTDSTFDVVSWNIEHFPKNVTVTKEKVKEVILALDPEVIAFQEIDDTDQFSQMISELAGYESIIGNYGYAPMCFVYKTDGVTVNSVNQLFASDNTSFPREPFELNLSYRGEQYVIIGNHLKCCGDGTLDKNNSGDEENRRYEAIKSLKEYIDTEWADAKVIVVGDYNDELDNDEDDNVFMPFIDDVDNYKFADMDIALGGSEYWSYPSWPSHLDHVLITNELFETSTVETIMVDDHITWSVYDTDISDHRPMGLKVDIGVPTSIPNVGQNKIVISPNPVNAELLIDGLSQEEDMAIVLYNSKGQLLASHSSRKSSSFPIAMESYAPGVYLVVLTGGESTFSQKVIKN